MRNRINRRVPFQEIRHEPLADLYPTPDFPPYAPSLRTRYSPPVDPLFVAFRVMQVMFVAMPIGAGMDKFFHLMANWDNYISPVVPFLTHIRVHEASLLIAPLEIAVGLMVAFKPRIGAIAAMFLFAVITMNLFITPGQLHVAFLHLCLCLNAFVLFILSRKR
ncbi:DoxX family membrane protein [soil metagenome]